MGYDPKQIGKRVETYRLCNKWEQEDLAIKTGYKQPYISKLEKGDGKFFNISTLDNIAVALNVSIDNLLEDNLTVFNENSNNDILYSNIKNHLEVLSVEELKYLITFINGFEDLKKLSEKDIVVE